MANSNDPVEALRKSLNAYTVSQDAIVEAAKAIDPPAAPPEKDGEHPWGGVR